MKTFSELAECLARIPPKITLYGLLFKYNYVGCLLLLMSSNDLLFAIKRDAYIFKETGWVCKFPEPQKLDKWTMAEEKRQTCWPKLHTETEYESQHTAIRWNRNIKKSWWQEKKRNKRQIYGLLVNARDVCRWTKQFKSRWKKGRQERTGDWGFAEVMFGFRLPGRYSLVFIDEGHQLELLICVRLTESAE